MIIYFKGDTYDLSDIVKNESISIGKTINKTFDRGSFIIPVVASDYFVGLDMSRPLPRNARVQFDIDGIEHNMIVSSDSVTEFNGTSNYIHEVELSSPTRLLYESMNTQYSVRQPQGDAPLYYRSISSISSELIVEKNATEALSLSTVVQSNNTSFFRR